MVPELRTIPIDERDMPHVRVVPGQLRGRTLAVATSLFVDQFARHPLWNAPAAHGP